MKKYQYRAMCKAYDRRTRKGKQRIPETVWTEIEARIREKWSPEQITATHDVRGQCTPNNTNMFTFQTLQTAPYNNLTR